jgi:uncharacterized protein YlxW (UPF0749 family)
MLTFSDYQKKKTGKKLHESTKEDNPDIIELVKELDRLQQKRKTAQETISIIDEEIKELRRYSGTFDG